MSPGKEREHALGAVYDGTRVTFRLFAPSAENVTLCLFDEPSDAVASRRVELQRGADGIWELVLDVGPGQLYGYRVSGPYDPQAGERFNEAKLLVDPWARAITGEPQMDAAIFGFEPNGWPRAGWHAHSSDLNRSGRDSAAAMPKCVVVDPSFEWQGDRSPRVPWSETLIYECHVKGMTRLHPEVPEELRGTYLGLVAPPVLEHLKTLGVTAVELLPVYQIAREPHLMIQGFQNYWGYSTLGYFAPHAGYATGGRGEQVREFKEMVRAFHAAGIEVILDVVYNHTAEGDHLGPTLSWKGIDNSAYYRLQPEDRRSYFGYSGCGATLETRHEIVRRFVLESLRYWVEEMHVDGFRFDLAPTLGRDGASGDHFDPQGSLLRAITEDPRLAGVKLIAEPWDIGHGGYQLGQFPAGWGEWNDRFRDAARRFWRGDGGAAELASRMIGSPDLMSGPKNSINFVTCHDGFTLRDLVSYEHKHNEANGEDNRDGNNHNLSRNWGWEGPSEDPGVDAMRQRARRNLAAALLLSRGVPMLLHGDELGRSQNGNNNAYCQDNELSWVDWSQSDPDFRAFVHRLVALRRRFPVLRSGLATARFWLADGREIHPGPESQEGAHWTLAVRMQNDQDDVVLLLNGRDHDVEFNVPELDESWTCLLDTAHADPGSGATLAPFSLRLFERGATSGL